MPREPRRHFSSEEERIELNARLLQLHDPDEIRARYWHTNMRIRRVVLSGVWLVSAAAAYGVVPWLVQATPWSTLASFCTALLWVFGHVLAVFGAVCFAAYCLSGGKLFNKFVE